MQVPSGRLRLPQRSYERFAHVIHLDRGEAQPDEALDRPDLADQPREVVACAPIAVAAEVDPGQHDLAMPLCHPPPHLCQHRVRRPAARPPAHLRMTQNEQPKLQPSWIFTNARTRSRRTSSRTQPMAPTAPGIALAAPSGGTVTTLTFSGRPASAPGSLAAQPVR